MPASASAPATIDAVIAMLERLGAGLAAAGSHRDRRPQQATRHPAFKAADPTHIDMFAAANGRLWAEIAQSSPSPWTKEMAQAARTWSSHRQTRKMP